MKMIMTLIKNHKNIVLFLITIMITDDDDDDFLENKNIALPLQMF